MKRIIISILLVLATIISACSGGQSTEPDTEGDTIIYNYYGSAGPTVLELYNPITDMSANDVLVSYKIKNNTPSNISSHTIKIASLWWPPFQNTNYETNITPIPAMSQGIFSIRVYTDGPVRELMELSVLECVFSW